MIKIKVEIFSYLIAITNLSIRECGYDETINYKVDCFLIINKRIIKTEREKLIDDYYYAFDYFLWCMC